MEESIVRYIDYTLLKPETTLEDIKKLSEEALKYNFFGICINGFFVKKAKEFINDSNIKLITVAGFPLGANTTNTKIYETKQAIKSGADEIDMVMNIGAMKSKNYRFVKDEITKVVKYAEGKIVKVILEIGLLTKEEIINGCKLVVEAGAHFVKTSTGFSSTGATIEDVKLLRETVGKDFGVKASGGIRDFETAKKMLQAGATRIGTSSGVKIALEEKSV